MIIVLENTKEEVIKVCEICIKSGKIISYEKPEAFISHYSRKDRHPIYKWKSIVTEKQ